jgi:hypothetical protein
MKPAPSETRWWVISPCLSPGRYAPPSGKFPRQRRFAHPRGLGCATTLIGSSRNGLVLDGLRFCKRGPSPDLQASSADLAMVPHCQIELRRLRCPCPDGIDPNRVHPQYEITNSAPPSLMHSVHRKAPDFYSRHRGSLARVGAVGKVKFRHRPAALREPVRHMFPSPMGYVPPGVHKGELKPFPQSSDGLLEGMTRSPMPSPLGLVRQALVGHGLPGALDWEARPREGRSSKSASTLGGRCSPPGTEPKAGRTACPTAGPWPAPERGSPSGSFPRIRDLDSTER